MTFFPRPNPQGNRFCALSGAVLGSGDRAGGFRARCDLEPYG
jgi:hypothetical protein